VVLVGFAGQVSLAQMAFAGVAGFTLSRLAERWGVPFPLAPLLAALIAMVFGVLVGLPALRVRGANLAIVTFAGGVAIAEFVFKNPELTGDASTGGAKVPNPTLGGWDLGLVRGTNASRPIFAVMLVVVAAVLAAMVGNLRRSATGRRILASRSNERAASAAGVNVGVAKVQAYAVSSFIAGVAGCLVAYRFGSVSDTSFGVIASLTTLAFAYLGGITSLSGAVVAGLMASSGVVFFGMSKLSSHSSKWEAFISGVLLIVAAVVNPSGISGGVRGAVERARARRVQVTA
jgi:branched-chain amino acid transport system permease protein